jgi:Holliday junction resolvase RusA-like endonuclease
MIEIRVIGTPGPQGSKSFKGLSKSGHAILTESSAKVKPWREAVIWAAREDGWKLSGPVAVQLFFTLPKPKSAPKRRVTFPDKTPDLDKLCRSTFDALTQAGTIEDDARIVSLLAQKCFPGEHADALDVPGVVIRIEAMA